MEDEEKIKNKEKNEDNELLLNKRKNSGLKIDLDIIEKEEENLADNNLEDEYLRFDSNYKPISKDLQKPKEQNNDNFCRKSSTISTTISMNENGFEVLPNKAYDVNNYENNDFCSQMFYSRNRAYSTPISNYFDETGNYLKGLNPEKNDYQKSNNYLQKEKFFRGHFPSFDYINKCIEGKNTENKIPPKLSDDLNFTSSNPLNSFFPSIDINQNYSQKNLNKNNTGKYDFPVYYFSYYNPDSKYILIFILNI